MFAFVMKGKKLKSPERKPKAKKSAPPVDAPKVETSPNPPDGVLIDAGNGELQVWPDPVSLLHEAEQETNYFNLVDYRPVIVTLRQKGFSFREISEWLSGRGIEVDHNAVYRIYEKYMSEDEEEQAQHQVHGSTP
jgi:hypothetical protein